MVISTKIGVVPAISLFFVNCLLFIVNCSLGVWPSGLRRLLWEQKIGGSNPLTPIFPLYIPPLAFLLFYAKLIQ